MQLRKTIAKTVLGGELHLRENVSKIPQAFSTEFVCRLDILVTNVFKK